MPNVIPWSYSSLNAFETCPRRFYLTRISKEVTEPQTAATVEGNRVHKALEHAVKGTAPLPPTLAKHQPMVDRLRSAKGHKFPEVKFGITSDGRATTFFAKDVWLRGVIDLAIVTAGSAAVIDYKTGKVKEDGDQLKLFAMAGFAQWPHVQTIHTNYLWLSAGSTTARRFEREELPAIRAEFEPRIERMERAQEMDNWPPRPSGLCRNWCPVGKRLCAHCGKD